MYFRLMKQTIGAAISLTIILFIASACGSSDSNSNNTDNAVKSGAMNSANGDNQRKIAYVNTDSLFDQYELRAELEEEFIEEKLMMENRFKTEVDAFEKDYRDAEAGAAQLSQEALQILSMKLQQREQELMVKKQEMEGQLMQSEQAKNDQLFEGLRTFLDEYAAQNGYDVIYGYNGLGDVLYMDAKYDITTEVVKAINDEYQNSKTADSASE